MSTMLDYPFAVFLVTLVVLGVSARIGHLFAEKIRPVKEDERADLDLVANASLTLLALIIGFSFSMALSRFDQRKTNEELEANAIATEYVRTGLLPVADAAQLRSQLLQYLDQRLLFYSPGDPSRLDAIRDDTTKLERQMWVEVLAAAGGQSTPATALVIAGMNDVMNRRESTQASWWNRIPLGGWCLMVGLAICCCVLVGYVARRRTGLFFMVLPFLVAVSFLFISDIDSPRRGVIRVVPENLISLSESLHRQ
jgi:hypothetical protein